MNFVAGLFDATTIFRRRSFSCTEHWPNIASKRVHKCTVIYSLPKRHIFLEGGNLIKYVYVSEDPFEHEFMCINNK